MRPVETLLLLANLVTFFVSAVPRLRVGRWRRYSALVAPPTAGAQALVEGPRAHRIINAYSVAFFDRHLKGLPSVLLDGPAGQYPEVLFETRRS